MRRRPLPLLGLILCVAAAAPADARLWKVRQDGSGDFTTIQAAINASVPGDSVVVWPGSYVENITFNGKGLVLLATAGPALTTINGSAQTRGPDNASTVHMYAYPAPPTLRGFTITGGRGTDYGGRVGGGVLIESAGEIVDCWITLNDAFYGGGVAVYAPDAVVRSCRISRNVAAYYGGGVIGYGRVVDSVISENTSTYPSGGAGAYMYYVGALENCTIVASYGAALSTLDSAGDVSVSRCVIAYSTFHELICGALPNLECNVIYNPKETGFCGNDLGGNLFADPLLCDLPGGDYSLTPGSPCLPANNSCGVLIGALPQGCGAVGLDAESWGSIKGRYWNR